MRKLPKITQACHDKPVAKFRSLDSVFHPIILCSVISMNMKTYCLQNPAFRFHWESNPKSAEKGSALSYKARITRWRVRLISITCISVPLLSGLPVTHSNHVPSHSWLSSPLPRGSAPSKECVPNHTALTRVLFQWRFLSVTTQSYAGYR